MATHDIDHKILGRLAKNTAETNTALSAALFKMLGLSMLLGRRLIHARKLRKFDQSRSSQSLNLYHHIIWMSREGLSLTEVSILPYTENGQEGVELQILAIKLRASFYHIFSLFHNEPPVTQQSSTHAALLNSANSSIPSRRDRTPETRSIQDSNSTSKVLKDSESGKTSQAPQATALRDSMTSETSYITNPYSTQPGMSPPPGFELLSGRAPQPPSFLLPAMNFLPLTDGAFKSAAAMAANLLPGSAPLRLSIALEYCAFLWDCHQDHVGCRKLASQTIANVYNEQEGMDDAEFEDASVLVGTLGRMMKRKRPDGTPKIGFGSPGNPAITGITSPIPNTPSPNETRPSSELPERRYNRTRKVSPRTDATVRTIPRRAVGTPPGISTSDRKTTKSAMVILPENQWLGSYCI